LKKLFFTLLLGALLFGCITSETEWNPENFEAFPTPTPTLNATVEPSPSPTPTLAPSPSPTPSPEASTTPPSTTTPTATPEIPDCYLTVQNLGEDNEKRVIVHYNMGDGNVYIRCNGSEDWQQVTLDTSLVAFVDCAYEQDETQNTFTAQATSNNAECSATVTIPIKSGSYAFAVTPSSESFIIDKTASNTTTRSYNATNAGDAELTGFKCYSNQPWAVLSTCPSSIAVNASQNASYTFNASGLSANSYSATLTFAANNAENRTVSVTLSVTQSTPAPTPEPPECSMTSANPTTMNRSQGGQNTSVITLTYSNFSGTLTPVFSSTLGGISNGDASCGAVPNGICTATWNFTSATAGNSSMTAALSGTACTGSVNVEVKD